MTGFGLHAAPPAGQWINDPNGLAFVAGRYRLFVQHRADAPDFVVTGWGRFSSDDLMHWDWDGEVLPARDEGFAYSGSITTGADARLSAWHTRHRSDGDPRERQYVADSHDGGLTWGALVGPFGPAGHNARDPFVFDHGGVRFMLFVRPGDWADAAGVSRIELASQDGRGDWSLGADIGLAIPAGLICEVPSLLRFGDRWALLASLVDRSGGGTASWTGYWLGDFDGGCFTPDRPAPTRLDLGPDFYAAIANLDVGWPIELVLIGWASSWATARQLAVAGGGSGGAISLPRAVEICGSVLDLTPIAAALPHARTLSWSVAATLTINSDEADLVVEVSNGWLQARRSGEAGWEWTCDHRDERIAGDLLLFHDAGLVELFIGGIAMTVMLPGQPMSTVWEPHNGG